MEPKEEKLLEALVYMAAQYLGDDEIDAISDSMFKNEALLSERFYRDFCE